MSEFVCPNTFCTFGPTLWTINWKGANIYTFGKVSSLGSPKISPADPQELQEKVIVAEV